MRILYQLVGTGMFKSFSGWSKISSKRIFTTKEKAEAYIGEFSKLCCESKDPALALVDLEPKSLEVKIVELELEE